MESSVVPSYDPCLWVPYPTIHCWKAEAWAEGWDPQLDCVLEMRMLSSSFTNEQAVCLAAVFAERVVGP